MTLVVVKKIAREVLLVADTASFDQSRRVGFEPLEVTPKIIPYPDCVVAFAGVIEPAHSGLAFRDTEFPTFNDVLSRCVALSDTYSGQLDFIVVEYVTRKIYKVSSGFCNEVSHSFIGDIDAFRRFQESFNRIGEDTLSCSESAAELHIDRVPDGSSSDFADLYTRTLRAFRDAFTDARAAAGGFAVPFAITEAINSFGSYIRSISGTNWKNEDGEGWRPVNLGFTETEWGSYAQSFTGSPSGFRITIPQNRWEVIWHSPFVVEVEPPVSPFINE